eukprot:3309521-Ditylum_brightwellii.AAC.2
MEQAILDTKQDNVENISSFIMELEQEEDKDENDAPLINKSSYLYYTSLENEVLDINNNNNNLSKTPALVVKQPSTATFHSAVK